MGARARRQDSLKLCDLVLEAPKRSDPSAVPGGTLRPCLFHQDQRLNLGVETCEPDGAGLVLCLIRGRPRRIVNVGNGGYHPWKRSSSTGCPSMRWSCTIRLASGGVTPLYFVAPGWTIKLGP